MNFLRGSVAVEIDGRVGVSIFENQSSGVMSSIAGSNVLIPIEPESKVALGQLLPVIPLANAELFNANISWPIE